LEVAVGIHRIEVPLGERLLCLYLLVGREGMLLVDTGSDQTPREHLVPYLQSIGRSAEEIDYVVITHSDRDHQGGNATLREIAPRALFMCHPLDQPLIESVDRLVEKRYSEFQQEHEIDENADAKIWIRQNNRSEVPISLTVTGGETLLPDDDWRIQIWHTPGHSLGHLSLYDARARIAIIADAALWKCVPTREGRPAFPPTYRYIQSYLATIRALKEASIDTLLTAHYPVLRGPEIRDFLSESRGFADQLGSMLRQELATTKSALTTRQLIEALSPRLGDWPAQAGIYLVFPLVGHLEELECLGRIEMIWGGGAVPWRWKL